MSGDGRVTNWTIVKSALWFNDKLIINFEKILLNIGKEAVEGTLKGQYGQNGFIFLSISYIFFSSSCFFSDGGRALSFKPDDESLYLVGTDEGLIHLCTTEYASQYINTFHAHNTPIYNIQWNTFLPNIFLTCAAEWTVKIWDRNYK